MSENNIEVELRSFITKEQHEKLLDFFTKQCGKTEPDEQVTYYFNAPVDVRIQKNDTHSKIWMKKGEMHSEQREEIEVKFPREDFDKLENIFVSLGFSVKVKWFRKRHTFSWNDFSVCVDENKGYGYILEIEKMSSLAEKDKTLSEIRSAFEKLGVLVTPKPVFDERYKNYLANWKELTKQ